MSLIDPRWVGKALHDNGNSGAAWTCSLKNGLYQKVVLNNDSVALTVDPVISGSLKVTPRTVLVWVYQDATGGRKITSASISGGSVYVPKNNDLDFPVGNGDLVFLEITFDGTNVGLGTGCEMEVWT